MKLKLKKKKIVVTGFYVCSNRWDAYIDYWHERLLHLRENWNSI